MSIELTSCPKARNLAPLKPAALTARNPIAAAIIRPRRPVRRASTMTRREFATRSTPKAAWKMRDGAPLPVIARVAQDSIYLDVLALAEDEIDLVADSLDWAAGQTVGSGGSAGRSGPREPDSLDPSAPGAPAHGLRPGDAPRPTRGPVADG